jgi:hypothetical protein
MQAIIVSIERRKGCDVSMRWKEESLQPGSIEFCVDVNYFERRRELHKPNNQISSAVRG